MISEEIEKENLKFLMIAVADFGAVTHIEKERAKAYAEKLDSAREMKKDGISDEQIAKFTKLSIEVIEKL